nr:outer envelope pore protein 16-4, chloroplastic-like isoform X3 [Physcomitrium patens]|eukprot:XP_024356421.1 outer envelope pore protein 16-4, chloroplastic-like isoform X3 [Physcomitrella patens]
MGSSTDSSACTLQAGVAWGMFMGSYDAVKEGHLGASRALYVAKSITRNGLGWGCFAGAYLGLNCGVESVRNKKDWVNASISGAITGAFVSARTGNVTKMLGTSVLVSAIATAGDFLRPAQYPPTGI